VGQLSPAKIDAIVSILTGPAGKTSLDAIDFVNSEIKMASGEKMVKPATSINELPGVRAIIRESSLTGGSSTQAVNDLYKVSERIDKVKSRLDGAAKNRPDELIDEYDRIKFLAPKVINEKGEFVKNENVELVQGAIEYIKKQQEKKLTIANPTTLLDPDTKKAYTAKSKREAIEAINYDINAAASFAMKEIRAREKASKRGK
jgi:hypothetical protein